MYGTIAAAWSGCSGSACTLRSPSVVWAALLTFTVFLSHVWHHCCCLIRLRWLCTARREAHIWFGLPYLFCCVVMHLALAPMAATMRPTVLQQLCMTHGEAQVWIEPPSPLVAACLRSTSTVIAGVSAGLIRVCLHTGSCHLRCVTHTCRCRQACLLKLGLRRVRTVLSSSDVPTAVMTTVTSGYTSHPPKWCAAIQGSDHTVELIAAILLPVAIIMCGYALTVFIWRAKAITKKQV